MKKACILIILLLIMGLIIGNVINNTYSKYSSSGEVGINGEAGAWVVKVNDQDITAENGITQTFTIQSLEYGNSEYVTQGKIAPGLDAYFQIGIDASDSAVAVKFDITFDTTNIELTDRINMGNVEKYVDGVLESNGITRTGENTYTGIIQLTDITDEKEITLKCYVEWPEDGTGTYDEIDSEMGSNLTNTSISIPVTVNVTQYLGETISEYTGA